MSPKKYLILVSSIFLKKFCPVSFVLKTIFTFSDNSNSPFSSLLKTLITLQSDCNNFKTRADPIVPVPPVTKIALFLK